MAPLAAAQEMVSVRGDNVNWRAGPGKQYPADWLLARGYPLKIIEKKGDWLHVSDFENDQDWIYRPLTGSAPHSIVKVKVANLRSMPTTASRIVATLSYGDILATLGEKSGWTKVRGDGGVQGWVSQALLWGW